MSFMPRSLNFGTLENVPKKKTGERRKLGVIQPNQTRLLNSNGKLIVNSPTRGTKRKNDENSQPCKSKRPDGIFEDPLPPAKKQKSFASIGVQTDMATEKIIIPRVPAKVEQEDKTELKEETVIKSDSEVKSKEAVTKSGAEESDAKPKEEKTTPSILDMLTADVAPPEYWEAVAEKRRVALEETLDENQVLHEENKNLQEEVKTLKTENKLLEDMVEEAKGLAELVESLTADASESEAEKESPVKAASSQPAETPVSEESEQETK